ncbi:MAG: Uncharacterized protein XD84_1533 [Desulfotomaculum sp. 46_80]|nr:MAG: Uncharacterized protein XD84_1533 [Desulfotomaculum sp. 46_80]
MKKYHILIETALIGQGIADLTGEDLLQIWKDYSARVSGSAGFVWLWQGNMMVDCLESLLEYRSQKNLPRIDSRIITEPNRTPGSGFCTAGAVLALANECQSELVVTAGMGGAFSGKVSSDLPEICKGQAVLIASGFKDMIEAQNSLAYLHKRNILIAGFSKPYYDGFLFQKDRYPLDRLYTGESISKLREDNCFLLFNDLETGLRLKNSNWLKDSIEAGKSAENVGGEFHPAVSRELARFSKSNSSRLQFEALLQNIVLAIKILEKGK